MANPNIIPPYFWSSWMYFSKFGYKSISTLSVRSISN